MKRPPSTVAREASTDDELRQRGILILRPEDAIAKVSEYVEQNLVTRYYGWTLPPGSRPSGPTSTSS